MKYMGRQIEYLTHNGNKHTGVIKNIEFHQGLKKPLFIIVTPFGNVARLSKEEIHKVI
ncbi:hypothetical protein ABEY43_06905 [Priestia megaterium]